MEGQKGGVLAQHGLGLPLQFVGRSQVTVKGMAKLGETARTKGKLKIPVLLLKGT